LPRHRVVAAGLILAALVVGVALPGGAGADDLASAKSRQKRLQADLDAATKELVQLENERHWAVQRLQAAQSRLGFVKADLQQARRVLGGAASSLYKAGGTRPLSGILGSSAEVVVSRVEFETIMLDGQLAAVADARVAFDSYEQAIRDVRAAMAQMQQLEQRAKKVVSGLAKNFEKAKQVADKLQGFNKTVLVGGRFVSCPVSPPFSYTDTWGASRSGGRAHKGTDIMNPYGNMVHAYVDGVIGRQTTSALGGMSIYLWGVDGKEYYYAHLSRYASQVGQRVKAGELIAYNGATGNAAYTAPHVHFEVHPGGAGSYPVNPYSYVRAACG
jgi:peptidoglycan LD-endopeptidase LytH